MTELPGVNAGGDSISSTRLALPRMQEASVWP